MKYFKVLIVLLSVVAISTCGSLDDIKGPPEVESIINYTPKGSTNDVFPVGVETKNKWSVEMVFNSGVPMGLANTASFSISGGGAVIESVSSADMSNRITVYLSNQSPDETYTITVVSTNIIDVQQTFSTNIDDTNQTSITNLTRVEGDSYSFKGYGHDDQTPPILDIFYPMAKVDINQALNERLTVYGFAHDDVELSKIEYKIDSGTYIETATASFFADIDVYALGDHRATIRATDLRGNTTARSVDFSIYRHIPDFALIAPYSPTIFVPGNSIQVKTTSSDSNITDENIRIETPITNYNYTAMSSVDGFEWTYDFTPDWTDNGECLFIAMMIYTNNAGVYFTNFTSNIATLYDNAVYLSANGSDSANGTRETPVRTIGRAISLGASLGIQNIKAGANSFGGYNFTANNITIDGGYSSDFLIHEPETFKTIFSSIKIQSRQNITVKNLFIENGGYGVSIDHSTGIVVSNCYITSSGRGLYARFSTVYIKNCNIYNCNTTYYGAGIYFCGLVSGEIKDNTITGNTASSGAGIHLDYLCSPVISGNTITGNTANGPANYAGGGAGIYVWYTSSPIISNNIISGNTANKIGGGICVWRSSSPIISDNTISDNIAQTQDGGGIYIWNNCSPIISNNIISGNTALSHYGGGICTDTDNNSPTITDNTVNDNTSRYHGGGMMMWYCSSAMVNNNIISGNKVTYYYGGGISVWGGSCTVNNNIITNNTLLNGGGGMIIYGNNHTISGNTISHNIANLGGGICVGPYSSPTISGGEISHNSQYGIYRWNGSSNPTISGVTHTGNTPSFKNW